MPSEYGVGFGGEGESYYLAGPNAAFWDARRPVKSILLWGHGAGSANGGPLGSPVNNPTRMGMVRKLVSSGVVVLTSDWGGKTWGNASSNVYVEQGRQAIMARLNVAQDVPVGVYGTSMGGLVMLNYTRKHPDKVAFVAAGIPLLDPGELRDRGLTLPSNNVLHEYAQDINARYGGNWSNATYGMQYSPRIYADQLPLDLPIHFWMAERDGTVPISTGHMFVAARPQTGFMTFDSGHNDATEKHYADDIVAFCLNHFPK